MRSTNIWPVVLGVVLIFSGYQAQETSEGTTEGVITDPSSTTGLPAVTEAPETTTGSPPTFPISCDFEDGDTCSFTPIVNANTTASWKMGKREAFSGPETSALIVDITATSANTSALLESPVLHIIEENHLCIEFYYRLTGNTSNKLDLNIRYSNNWTNWENWTTLGLPDKVNIWTISGDQGRSWKHLRTETDTWGDSFLQFGAFIGENVNEDSVIGIDDVRIYECSDDGFPNPPPGLSMVVCNFEIDLCGFESVVDENTTLPWQIVSNSSLVGSNRSAVLVEMSQESINQTARLKSPTLRVKESHHICVEFYYRLSAGAESEIHVNVRYANWTELGLPELFDVLVIKGDKGNRWRYGRTETYGAGPTTINFEAHVRGTVDAQSIIGLDDIILSECDESGFPNLPPINYPVSCDFETDECEFRQVLNSNSTVGWIRGTRESFIGPDENALVVNFKEGDENQKARLSSPELRVTDGNHLCIEFYYRLSGPPSAELHVNVRYGELGDVGLLDVLSFRGDQSSRWKYGRVETEAIGTATTINFEAHIGSAIYDSIFIGIDDIVIDECSDETGFTHNPPSYPISCDFESGDINDCPLKKGSGSLSVGWLVGPRDIGFSLQENAVFVDTQSEGAVNKTARLTTPLLEVGPANHLCIEFYYRLSNLPASELRLQYNTESDSDNITVAWATSGQTSKNWHYARAETSRGGYTFLTFEAELGDLISSSSIVGLDDILIYECDADGFSTPPPMPLSCDFDGNPGDACGWSSVKGFYPWSWSRSTTPSLYTGPTSDYTQNGSKGYVFIEASGRKLGDEFRLRSPVIPPPTTDKHICVSFHTHMMGENMGQIALQTVELDQFGGILPVNPDRPSRVLWIRSGDHDNYWKPAKIAFSTENALKLDIVGVNGKDHLGDAAVDGIKIEHCSSTDGFSIYSSENGTILDGPPMPERGSLPLKCDFQQNRCGFVNDPSDNADWMRIDGESETDMTGPSADHTTDTSKGRYLYVESSLPAKEGDVARLVSPVFEVPENQSLCAVFYYHMFGSGMGELSVVLHSQRNENNVTLSTVWTMKGDQGDKWHRAQLQVNSSGEMMIMFKATVGKDFRSDIALDDVHLFQCTDPIEWPEEVTIVSPYPDGCSQPAFLQSSNGTIASSASYPNGVYKPNSACRWTISTLDVDNVLELVFDGEFFVEASDRCEFDYVRIFDGVDQSSLAALKPCGPTTLPFKGPYCGSYVPDDYTSVSGNVTVEFCSDHRNHRPGFLMTWNETTESSPLTPSPNCSSTIILKASESQFFNIPANRGQNYPNNLLCETKISHENPNGSIIINTGMFDLEKSNGCEFDYLEISENCKMQQSTRYCGYMGPVHHQSECQEVTVRFVSDSSESGKGLEIVALSAECPNGHFSCGDGSCITTTQLCNGLSECRDGRDESAVVCDNLVNCGKPHNDSFFSDFGEGGSQSKPLHGWHVAILTKTRRIACSGVLISGEWIITAAQCVNRFMHIDEMIIRLDAPFLDFKTWPLGTEVTAEKVVVHPSFTSTSFIQNDIALIKFRRPSGLGIWRSNVCLPDNDRDLVKNGSAAVTDHFSHVRNVNVSGDADLEPFRNISIFSENSPVTVISNALCTESGAFGISNSKVCTTGMPCEIEGDLGAPLVFQRKGIFYLGGLYSYSSTECRNTSPSRSPSVFTRFQSYSNWVLDVLARDAYDFYKT